MSTPPYRGERGIPKAAKPNLKATEILFERGLLPPLIVEDSEDPTVDMDSGVLGEGSS